MDSVRALDVVKNKRIYIPHPSTFNDPYDWGVYFKSSIESEIWENASNSSIFPNLALISKPLANRDQYPPSSAILLHDDCRKAIADYHANRGLNPKQEIDRIFEPLYKKNELAKMFIIYTIKIGMLCLTKDPRNLLMWSHYAEHHKGICLEFEFPLPNDDIDNGFTIFNEETKRTVGNAITLDTVEYSTKKPMPFEADNITNDTMKLFTRQILTKSSDWSYEKEWRLLFSIEEKSRYLDVSEFLKCAIAGVRSEKSLWSPLKTLCDESDIDFKRASLDQQVYQIRVS